jgi:hypothetical protein
MSRITKSLVVALLFVFAATVCAFADPVQVNFVGVSGNSQNGVYVYPYYLTINDGPQIPVICHDFYHHSAVGDIWQANITSLVGGDLSNTRFGNLPDALHLYQEAGFLLMQTNDSGQAEWGNINFAVWMIFNPSVDPGTPPPGTKGAAYWLNLAQTTDLSHIDFSGVNIVTPLDAHGEGGDQEFIYVTPEPATLMMIGTGLLGLFSQRKRFV